MCLHYGYCKCTCVVAAVLGGCMVECTLLSGFVLSWQVLKCAIVAAVVHCVKGFWRLVGISSVGWMHGGCMSVS